MGIKLLAVMDGESQNLLLELMKIKHQLMMRIKQKSCSETCREIVSGLSSLYEEMRFLVFIFIF